ncbi:long-chain fatty acid--CoA ligase [Pseudoroseomonas cervicalis]|uniref:AMP-dependent synthetase/ligase n=1 Tax=Teichococcus cervicalis TaxID=204525 RepID=UPI0022F14A54|nr:long-chain fatty acid--CoA ligase [Pseudoroseomonas cervicalis]WBV44455.1 long-chain fatty acid--CoA ligase [Pseudoroseomonas cervicalis]
MPAEENWTSLPALILGQARSWPDRPMLRYWRGGGWRSLNWADFALQVASVAAGLRARGICPGDRVLLVAENRPEFLVADMAVMAIGAVTVPGYTTNTLADHAHLIRDSGARAAIVSTARLAQSVGEAAGIGGLDLLVSMEDSPGSTPWSELAETRGDLAMLYAEVEQIPAGRLACLIYTSGTGGPPKGVMLPHRAMLANRRGITDFIRQLRLPRDACYLSFLPLSHAYEHTVIYLLCSFGMEVVFSRGAEKLSSELAEIRPHVLTAVPRLFEVLRARLLAGLEKQSSLNRALFERTCRIGMKRLEGERLGLAERLMDPLLDRLVRAKVRARFGGRLVAMVSGGARLDPDLSGFFMALGLPVLQGYGQTEAGPVISVNVPWDNDRRSVGRPLPGVTLRIAEDGEVLVRGDLVMDGYWNQPEATAQSVRALPDGEAGWLHTGDVGELVEGRLRITDRKRDFIKTLGGEMVSPARLESLLMAEPEIAQAVVAGEGRPALSALLVPADKQDEPAVAAALRRVNGKLSGVERIRHFALVPPFTVENGQMTPTMKVKRRIVLRDHEAQIARLYE